MFRHILVPTDGSHLSTRAVKYAIKLAKATGARITVLHVIPNLSPTDFLDGAAIYPDLYSPAEYRRASQTHARQILAKVETLARTAKVECDTTFTTGIPWQAIIKTAKSKDCGLIVMASHGRRGLGAVLLGSETAKVLTHSKTPVLVCR